MFRKLVVTGIFAGFAAGLIAAALQIAFVVPVLLEGELYESGEMVHFAGSIVENDATGTAHDHGSHDHGDAGTDLMRHVLTILSLIAAFCGFGLILTALFALAARRGHVTDGRVGILWGVAGFIVVQLAPAAGLAPELPGAVAADLVTRQIWWIAAVLFTAGGVWIIAFAQHWAPWALGAMLIIAPHIYGAPHPAELGGVAPPELAGLFASRSLAIGLASWVCLGVIAGHLWRRDTAIV